MVITSFSDISTKLCLLSKPFTILTFIILSILYATCQNEELLTRKYLNVKCDFERVPGGGCHLRESYCSSHMCICKPDFPINIADRLCLVRLKNVGEMCTYSQECQTGSFCDEVDGAKVCQCKTGYAFSEKSKMCVKGLKGSICKNSSDCSGPDIFCSILVCECKYGFEWYVSEESCYKKAKFGESCETTINCKMHDEFSVCDPQSKQCTCGQFLSRKYALDEVTHKCVSCPRKRYHDSTNICLAEKTAVEIDQSAYEHHYIYIALSMTPFIVFALIGFIYRYVSPDAAYQDNSSEQGLDVDQMLSMSLLPNSGHEFCLHLDVRLLTTPAMHDPPPSYDIASKDLPPSYDEVVYRTHRHQTQY